MESTLLYVGNACARNRPECMGAAAAEVVASAVMLNWIFDSCPVYAARKRLPAYGGQACLGRGRRAELHG